MKRFTTAIALCLLSFNIAFAQEIIMKAEKVMPINVSSDMLIFTDSSAKIPFEQVKSQHFTKNSKKNYCVFPFSNNVYWVKFQFKNPDSFNREFVLVWQNPMVERLDFYLSDSLNKNYQLTVNELYTFQKFRKLYEEQPHFAFDIAPNSSKTLFIRIDARRGHYGAVRLHSADSYTNFRYESLASDGLSNGLTIFRLFLVLVLSLFIIKESIFRAYSFQIFLKSATYWGLQNCLGPLFTDSSAWAVVINFWGTNASVVGACVFVLWSLVLEKFPKKIAYGLYFFIISSIVIDFLVAVDYQWYWLKAGVINTVCGIFFILCIYVYAIYKKITFNVYYTIPFLLGITGYFLMNVRLLTGIENRLIGSVIGILFLGDIFLFVLFLGQILKKTELNKAIAERKLSFNIEQNNRLKEIDNLKTTFFTNISHELRTPLTLITAPIQELLNRYPSDKQLPLVHRNAQRLLTLINQLLDISKLEAGQMNVEMRESNVSRFLKVLVSSFSSLAESKKVELHHNFQQQDIWGYIDQDKTDKIVTNLLSNALKFSPEGGKVMVDGRLSENTKNLIITVKDTGIGISKEKLSKIFDRFYQVDDTQNRNYEGTGIGLALVKELVSVLKGIINVTSQEGQGTKFVVTLPIDHETWENETVKDNINHTSSTIFYPEIKPQTAETKPSFDGVKNTENTADILLIVDDNEDIRSYIRTVFEDKYQIIEAINGKDGILKAQETTPNLIISDLMMPEMNGFEFCKFIKSNETTSHIPVIMLTAKANVESKIEGFELGADDYLIKPFNTAEIQVRVKNLLDKQENLRRYFTGNAIENLPKPVQYNPLEDLFLKKAKSIIEKHLDENGFGIEKFCQEINMSSSQLLRKLKALTNQTTVEFIREYRLQRASNMLAKSESTVSEVAFAVGFESLSYFGKAFQEKFGVLPSEYREKVEGII